MNHSQIDKLVEAVLYEGFILYPYRPSVKNTHRWTFGGLYPRDFCEAQPSVESPSMQVQCLIEGGSEATVEVTIRFLRLVSRKIGKLAAPLTDWSDDELEFEPVECLMVDERPFHCWQEAVEQTMSMDRLRLDEVRDAPRKASFEFPAGTQREPMRDREGRCVGLIDRTRHALSGSIEIHAEEVAANCFRFTARAANETRLEPATPIDRDEALLRCFAAASALVVVDGGQLVSQFDPPDDRRELAAANQNLGWWPVLVGEPPDRTTMLAAPIILYDYPQVAAESPAGLYDSTEIDEILTLRIMTLTEDEKLAMGAIDPRGRDLLQHVEALTPEGMLQLHGATRDAEGRTEFVPFPPRDQ
jgi:hypothetical protein